MQRLFFLAFALFFSLAAHAANPQVEMKTSQGTLIIELYQDKAPKVGGELSAICQRWLLQGHDISSCD